MDDNLNVEETGLGLNIEPQVQAEEGVIHTPIVEEEGRIDEFPEETFDPIDELDPKNYIKVTPTLYVRPAELEEGEEKEVDEEGNEIDLYMILNPETGVVEKRELTDEEKHEILVLQLKEDKKVFKPTKHPVRTVGIVSTDHWFLKDKNGDPIQIRTKEKEVVTNVTENKYGPKYKQKRKSKNSLKKKSRRANR